MDTRNLAGVYLKNLKPRAPHSALYGGAANNLK